MSSPTGIDRARGPRRLPRLLPRGVAARMALTFLLLFGGASALIMGGIYVLTAHSLRAQVDAAITEDVVLLANMARERGPRGLAIQVVRQARLAGENQAVFLYARDDGTPIAGNLTHWPEGLPTRGRLDAERDRFDFTSVTTDLPPHRDDRDRNPPGRNTRDDRRAPPMGPPMAPFDPSMTPGAPEEMHDAMHADRSPPWKPGDIRLVTLTLPGGDRLLVGRDMGPVESQLERLGFAMRLGLLATVLLALIGGWWMSRRFARRLEGVTQASREIMAGDLSRRVPQGKGPDGDDFDQLATNLNAMLARIESLMEGVRHVSDTIAHDLRTPLARLRNRLETLQADHADGAEREELGKALREVDGLLATFNALLRIAQVETGGRRVSFAPVELDTLLADVVELYDALAEDAGVALNTETTTAVSVDGDRDLLFQAFANLMDNAVKFSPEGAPITLSLTRDTDQAVITLVDHGPGIPEGDRSRVFERFARLEQSRTTPGNGLGLTMVGAVIEAHGGTIALSDTPGGGLTITLRLRVRSPNE